MLIVKCPDSHPNERAYVLKMVFDEFLGIPVRLADAAPSGTTVIAAEDGRQLVLPDLLLGTTDDVWLTPKTMPREPLRRWKTDESGLEALLTNSILPVLFGADPSDPEFLRISEGEIDLGLDIFGSIFFLLTRIEEVTTPAVDQHGRFPASASIAVREHFLDRPLVDEYVEILWACLQRLWPSLERRPRQFRVSPTHDVDNPVRYRRFTDIIRPCGVATLKQGRPDRAAAMVAGWAASRARPERDPWFTFPYIMETNEAHGVSGTFFFLTDREHTPFNGNFPFTHPLMEDLLLDIAGRGHFIGLHPSYGTWTDPAQMSKEFSILKQTAERLGIRQEKWGVRQHYLHAKSPETWAHWESCGFDWDSTMMFADMPGFRCGTSHSFPLFDLRRGKALSVREHPLIAMECSVLDDRYMGLGANPEQAFGIFAKLKDRCRMFGGDYVLLWHNNRFVDPLERQMYSDILNF